MPRQNWLRRIVPVAVMLAVAGLALGQFGRGPQPYRPPVRVTPTPGVGSGYRGSGWPGGVHGGPWGGTGFQPGRTPGMPSRGLGPSPLHSELHLLSRVHPHETLGRLSNVAPGLALPHYEHRLLARQSLDRLASLQQRALTTGGDVWPVVQSLRTVNGPHLGEHRMAELSAVQAGLERQAVRQGVTRVVEAAERKLWGEASAAARRWLQEDARASAASERRQPFPEQETLRQTLREIDRLSTGAEGLERAEASLRTVPRDNPRQFLDTVQRVGREALPPESLRAVDGLRALEELRAAGSAAWKEPPDVARLQQQVADFRRALAELPGQPDAALPGRIQQDLAARAFLEGHTEAALALWPTDGSPAHAANLLRDIKALATGKDEVRTGPGQGALPPGGGKPPKPPVGLGPLLPEGSGDGWRPPPRGKATEGLPPLEEAARPAQALGESVVRKVEERRTTLSTRLQPHFQQLQHLQQQARQRDEKEKKQLDEVEKKLSAPLQPAERTWAAEQLAVGGDAGQVVARVQAERTADEIEKWLALLKSYLDVRLKDGRLIGAEALKKRGVPWAEEWFDGTDKAEQRILEWAGEQLRGGKPLPEVAAQIAEVLRPEAQEAPGGVGRAVTLDLVALELEPGLDAFENARAEELLGKGKARGEVVALLRAERQRQKRKDDLERVKVYLDRPAKEEELTKARELLEGGKEVAEVVAQLPDALSPARREVPGGVREAVWLDEVAEELGDPLDAPEFARARQLLRGGRTPADVAAVLALRRAEAAEAEAQRRLVKVKEKLGGFVNERQQTMILNLLRAGRSVEDVVSLFSE